MLELILNLITWLQFAAIAVGSSSSSRPSWTSADNGQVAATSSAWMSAATLALLYHWLRGMPYCRGCCCSMLCCTVYLGTGICGVAKQHLQRYQRNVLQTTTSLSLTPAGGTPCIHVLGVVCWGKSVLHNRLHAQKEHAAKHIHWGIIIPPCL